MDAETLLTRLVAALDERAWDAIGPLTAPGFSCTFLHTGEVFDAGAYARFQHDYPGVWRVHLEDLVATGDRAVARARISDGAGSGATYHVAMFATARDGLLSDLVEVWADGSSEPPRGTRAG
jgi:hypothetical protein